MCFSSQPVRSGNFAACTDSSHDIPIILKTAFTVKLLHPNGREVEFDSFARGAAPDCGDGGDCQFCTRRRKLSCQRANARAGFCGRLASPHPLLRRAHPIAGTVESISPAHAADSRFASRQMLCRFVLIVRTGLCAACGNSCGRLYPNGSDAEVFSSARVAGNYLVRTQILARVSAGGLQALHPIVGTAEPASFARGAGVRPAREQMLSRFVLAVPLVFAYCALIYEWGEWSDLPTPFSSRVCSPVFCPPHAFSCPIFMPR